VSFPVVATSNVASNNSLLDVRQLQKYFPIRKGFLGRTSGWVKAVDGVSLSISSGKTLGLVGESGCGKTTAGRAILRLIEPSGGSVSFRGQDVLGLRGDDLRRLRRKMQIIFQDPYSSLNPRITVGGMLAEILRFHKLVSPDHIRERVNQLLEEVGLSPQYASRYPHEFSGGQRQRIGIVRALAVQPEFLVLDEPVSALDVSIQAQILNLLKDLQTRYQLSYLFISHALSVVEHIADEIAVMYLGRIVESGSTEAVIGTPLHPYTKALLAAAPRPDPDRRAESEPLGGDVPSPANPPSGCHFHPRCPVARPECQKWEYAMETVGDGRKVACIMYKSQS
jgi:oligopeptide transport system ATP-binding protein